LLIEVHHLGTTVKTKQEIENSDEEDTALTTEDVSSEDDDHEEILYRDSQILKMIKSHDYPDAEIDKVLQSLKDKGVVFSNDILNGEYIENDIRLSEAIREAIEEIKFA
jgi:hypothetical protein